MLIIAQLDVIMRRATVLWHSKSSDKAVFGLRHFIVAALRRRPLNASVVFTQLRRVSRVTLTSSQPAALSAVAKHCSLIVQLMLLLLLQTTSDYTRVTQSPCPSWTRRVPTPV